MEDLSEYLVGHGYCLSLSNRVQEAYNGGIPGVQSLVRTLPDEVMQDHILADVEAWRDMQDHNQFMVGL